MKAATTDIRVRPIAIPAQTSFAPTRIGLLQRKCACGGTPRMDGTCEECRKKELGVQRLAIGNHNPRLAPPIVHEVLNSPGQPLPATERAFFEPRFGHDFSRVRVHTDERAAESAAAIQSRAYTVGEQVAFGAGEFRPETSSGRELLAHELAHVTQHGGTTSSGKLAVEAPTDKSEYEADQCASEVLAGPTGRALNTFIGPRVRRRLVVHDPSGKPASAPPGVTNESIVDGYVRQLCNLFKVSGGAIAPINPASCPAPLVLLHATSCGCLCDMHTLPDTWTVQVNDADWPHTTFAANTVTVHSPFSGAQFGAWTAGTGEHRMEQPNWLVLGHELCGHSHLEVVAGVRPPNTAPVHGGRTTHDPTIGVENAIAAEHGRPATELRGAHATSRHHGESFARVTVAGFPSGSADISMLPATEVVHLDEAAAFATRGAQAPAQIEVIGHADAPGGHSANLAESACALMLSGRRYYLVACQQRSWSAS